MAYEINRILTIPRSAFHQSIQEEILKKTEELVHNRLFFVDFKELKSDDNRKRKFYVTKAYNQRDK